MPRGKELEQLPMANTAPSAGRDMRKWDRESLKEAPSIEPRNLETSISGSDTEN
ncbi:hypothetical protein [Bacillus sp. V5-8f]|uniref:hypothetical protein n=1 Tax=Bacillus sp. V5-8f TaxID=2053044 RepID=UPI0015E11891|nr:hypothetical protein [Bacillus sp. V5-8f]